MKIYQFLQFLTVLFAPLYILRNNTFFPTTLLEVLILSTGISFLYQFVKDKCPVEKLKTKLDLYIIFILLTGFISTFFNPDFLSSLGIYRAYFLEPVLFFYTLVYAFRTSKRTDYLIVALILSGGWLAVLSAFQNLIGLFVFAPNEMVLGRVTAVYNSANALALYIGPIAVLSLALFFRIKSVYKWLAAGIFILLTIVMIWTRSRGGIIAEIFAVISLIFLLFTVFKKIAIKSWFLIPIVVLICSVWFFSYVHNNYKDSPVDYNQNGPSSDTLQIRYFLWLGTVDLIKDNPFFGVGLEGFKNRYEKEYRLHKDHEAFQYPHNIFLTIFAEMGFLGLLAFIFFIVKLIELFVRRFAENNKLFGLGLLVMGVYWLVHGLVDVPYFKNDLSLEFWAWVGLIIGWSEGKFNQD